MLGHFRKLKSEVTKLSLLSKNILSIKVLNIVTFLSFLHILIIVFYLWLFARLGFLIIFHCAQFIKDRYGFFPNHKDISDLILLEAILTIFLHLSVFTCCSHLT